MRVAWFPKGEDLRENPYWERLQAELEALGVAFEASHNGRWLAGRWLWEHRHRVDVLHFHFIEPQYAGMDGTVSCRRLLKFGAYLILIRLLGYRLVWTMHELVPTWPMRPVWLERLGRLMMAWTAHRVIVHCNEARRLLARRLLRFWDVTVQPLPSYAGCYSNDVLPQEARDQLGIGRDRFVLAFLGGIRPNKGLEELVTAFSQLHDPNAILLIAGRPWPPRDYIERICRLAAADGRIYVHAKRIPDDMITLYLKAADALVFPFKHVLVSSSVVLAMSFGRPVIVPRLGCLSELVNDDAGILYDPADPEGLAKALQRAKEVDLEAMGRVAERRVNAFSWRDLARETLKVYLGS